MSNRLKNERFWNFIIAHMRKDIKLIKLIEVVVSTKIDHIVFHYESWGCSILYKKRKNCSRNIKITFIERKIRGNYEQKLLANIIVHLQYIPMMMMK